eukprot:CAMPEP_0117605282 /NCGR_PEP_ID=MMETSP0784-20121206/79115_1 /TAXON_ID=39447 /ORGANISM="" /LENGTH=192 /DNA_ID=CAMNT_0005408325 /DNA_START=24 /DNA_END=602 /DNA_ORIENTATION=+
MGSLGGLGTRAFEGMHKSQWRARGAHPHLDPSKSELDRFLSENRIDQAGIASLRCEPVDIQKAVMAKGPLVNTNNPSASLMARIRMVKMDRESGMGMFAPGGTMPGALGAAPVQVAAAPNPALALEDSRHSANVSIDNSSLNDEAFKAIQKLSANIGVQPGTEPAAENGCVGQPIADNKAIQALSANEAADL